jgi:hypothetical protein
LDPLTAALVFKGDLDAPLWGVPCKGDGGHVELAGMHAAIGEPRVERNIGVGNALLRRQHGLLVDVGATSVVRPQSKTWRPIHVTSAWRAASTLSNKASASVDHQLYYFSY